MDFQRRDGATLLASTSRPRPTRQKGRPQTWKHYNHLVPELLLAVSDNRWDCLLERLRYLPQRNSPYENNRQLIAGVARRCRRC
jgi:hypothetical protein